MTELQHLRPRTLRALADALEARQGPDANHLCAADLTDEGVERLADMLTYRPTQSFPTVGFWRKHRRPS